MHRKSKHATPRSDFHLGPIFWCGLLNGVLLLILIIVNIVFFAGMGAMKGSANDALEISRKMLSFTEQMQATVPLEDIVYLIEEGAKFVNRTDFDSINNLLQNSNKFPIENIGYLLNVAVDIANSTDFRAIDHFVNSAVTLLDQQSNRYLTIFDNIASASNKTTLLLDRIDIEQLTEETAHSIALLNSVIPSYVQQTQEIITEVRNITASASQILAHLFKTHKVNIEL